MSEFELLKESYERVAEENRQLRAQIEVSNKQEPVAEILSTNNTGSGSYFNMNWLNHLILRAGDKLYLSPQAPVNAIADWVLVTKDFLKDKPEWFYGSLWIYEGHNVYIGRYEWRQGWGSDRLICDGFDIDAVGKYVQSCSKPPAPQPDNNRSQDGE